LGFLKPWLLLILEFAKGMEERFWFPVSAAIIDLRRCSLSIIGSYFQQTYRDFVQSSIACVAGLPTRAS
jgi:hypothetical protein